jgi:UDP-N-acetylmuramoyl-L-alanyl-D-glutamate--2,6-diaminopimelate ligase
MRLTDILAPDLAAAAGVGDAGPVGTGVTADSRRAGPGVVFFAVPGTRVDGLAFAAQAAAAGAAAVVGEGPRPADLPPETA